MSRKKKKTVAAAAGPGPEATRLTPVMVRNVALLILGAGLVIRLAVAWQPFDFQLKYGPLVDDAFYSLNIARHIARGEGTTCDGINYTNGFQPLYVFLMVPAYWAWPADPVKPVYAAMTLLALASAGAGWFLFRIARRSWGPGPAWFALGIYSLSPYFIIHGINGLETSLAGLGWMAALDLYLGRIKPGHDSWKDRAALAAALAALVFTRIDGGIVAVAISLDYLFRPGTGGKPMRDRIIALAQIAGLALLLYAPWAGWNLAYFGEPLPTSGRAVRLMSEIFGDWELGFTIPAFEPGHAPLKFYLANFCHIFRVRIYGQVFFPVDPVFFLLWEAGQILKIKALSSLPVSLALFAAGIAWARRIERNSDALFIAVALMFGAYGFYVFGHWFFNRYLFPAEMCLTLLSAAVLRDLWDRVNKNIIVYVFIIIGAMYAVVIYGSGRINFLENKADKIANFYVVAQALDANVPEGDRIGVFQSGAIAYFAKRQVINLDGVVNENAYLALKDKRMARYLEENNIAYVADYSWILDRLFFQRLHPGERESYKLVSPKGSIVQVYKRE